MCLFCVILVLQVYIVEMAVDLGVGSEEMALKLNDRKKFRYSLCC